MLKINNLIIKYNNRAILDSTNLSFKRGTINIIKGDSGSGKSSILNILGLIQKPNNECIYTLDDKKIVYNNEKYTSLFRLQKIGFVFQQNNLIQNLTTLENITLPMQMQNNDQKKISERANKLIDFVGLQDVVNSYPSDLSGGEEQRIAIARAITNDADIILADEPTAALDSKNSKIILDLFEKLAYVLNKIVIIVSHDNIFDKSADNIFEIKNKKLVTIKKINISKLDNYDTKIVNNKPKTIFKFVKYYSKNRKTEKKISSLLIFVTAMIAAISTLFINFGDTTTVKQTKFINSISENSIFIVNDTMGLNSQSDYSEALSFTEEEQQKISSLPRISKLYPYYEFSSNGQTKDVESNEKAKITLKNNNSVLKTITFDNNPESFEGNQFRVVPYYKQENLEYVISEKDKKTNLREGIILSSVLAKQLSDSPKYLVGKSLQIDCFVPTKSYISEATKPTNGERSNIDNEETLKIDGHIYIKVSLNFPITGILEKSYDYKKSEENKNFIFLDYDKLIKIINDNKDSTLGETFPGFQEKQLNPSSLTAYVSNFEDVSIVKDKIENISQNIITISKASDVKALKQNINSTKTTMTIVSIILVIIVMMMFMFVYYFKNKTRKKEVGILKAIGLRPYDIVLLIGYDMIKVALQTFCLSIIIASLLIFLTKFIGMDDIFIITPMSLLYCLFLSFFIVVISGISSIWKTSKIDIIDAIRKNK